MAASGEPMEFGDQSLREKTKLIPSVVKDQTMMAGKKETLKTIRELFDQAAASPMKRALKDQTDK